MSKIFYDRLIILERVEKEINSISKSKEEKDELWQIVDEMIHHRVLGCVLDKLPAKNHEEFLHKLNIAPHDEALLDYLKEKINEDIEKFITAEMENLSLEIIEQISNKSSKKNK